MIVQILTSTILTVMIVGIWYLLCELKEIKCFYKDSLEMDDQIMKMVNRIEKRVSNLENRNRGL